MVQVYKITIKRKTMIYTIRLFLIVTFLSEFLSAEARLDNRKQFEESGIQWTSGLSWSELRKKAHDENKYIFLDCFATWCHPCKVMDKNVYPNDTIGRLMNTDFICVRVQMDSTKNDNEEIREWYKTVKALKNEYAINSMPTLLFFRPDGKIVHKKVGGQNVKQFISLITNVTDPENQYYTLVDKYRRGTLDYARMPVLARMAHSVDERDFAAEVARIYMVNYLNQDEHRFFIKENQQFIYDFSFAMLRSSDRLFKLYLQQPAKMDTVIGKSGKSQLIVEYVITKEEISPVMNLSKEEGREPAWSIVANQIEKKYGVIYAERLTVNAKLKFYKSQKDWPHYARFLVQKVEMEKKIGAPELENAALLNSDAWNIFLYSNRKSDLKKALNWSKRSLQLVNRVSYNVAPYMDTQANILYKLRRVQEAIKLEEEVVRRITIDAEKYAFIKSSIEGYRKTLQKMKNGEPTHLENGAIWNHKLK